MPTPEDLAPLVPAMTAWRQDLHRHPELGFEERRTAAFVAETLRGFGIEVAEGIARTGVVGTVRGRPGNRAIALRADMDALAMTEATGLAYASATPGRMHACGHDGHTAMLLGAAHWLARHRDRFAGTVHLVFQPAEESLGGARVMVEEGLLDRFPVDAIYGLHNLPGLLLGTIAVPKGPVLASSDTWEVSFRGAGTHGAKPHLGTDAALAAAQFVTALQAIASREVDPLGTAVVSVGHIAAGDAAAPNVIPAQVFLKGTARALDEAVRSHVETRIAEIAHAVAALHRLQAEPRYIRRLSPTVNHATQAAMMVRAAQACAGPAMTRDDHPPITAGEDFSEFLARIPGAYAWLGTGDPAHPEGWHHNPHFDFNDAALAHGAAFWCSLVETELA
ncbi:M20 aminoacylase family protein [Falsiroseomonas oryziterrae]|uniref:M20 aminoacylase family protein n=1 Tax=Falsiroseomonas oryziterrae TaxID=2911368 RepID=UPI001F2BF387|nr:M20 aminoacylase family protein [Roseomonas sp. NPKOSM-4]